MAWYRDYTVNERHQEAGHTDTVFTGSRGDAFAQAQTLSTETPFPYDIITPAGIWIASYQNGEQI